MTGLFLMLCALPQEVSYPDLLAATHDLEALAEAPEPGVRAFQFSSFDRRSLAGPGDPEAWFANEDRGHYLRTEEGADGPEYVLAEVEGPAVLTRIWSANPSGTLHFYVDGAEHPTWSVAMETFLGGDGKAPFAAPLCAVRSRGWNSYLPVPFNRSLRLTATAGDLYYQVGVRTFPAGTTLPTFSGKLLLEHQESITATNQALLAPATKKVRQVLRVGEARKTTPWKVEIQGEGIVHALDLEIISPFKESELPDLLRTLRLEIGNLEGNETWVSCPLGDFFGAAPGFQVYQALPMSMTKDGHFHCRFPMPYSEGFRMTIHRDAPGRSAFKMLLSFEETKAPPLRFRAGWKRVPNLKTRPMSDLSVLRAEGPGRFVGCALTVLNPVRGWWGEGDEKIRVDGEEFPSTFGTGTEDYFGYAWCDPALFTAPFHAQSRCDGPGTFGYTSLARFQIADAIPFQSSLDFDLEVWHWEDVEMDYAVTAWWYGAPETGGGFPELPSWEDRLPAPLPEADFRRVAGALEAEALEIVQVSGGEAGPQEMGAYGKAWSGARQVWWRGATEGDQVVLSFSLEESGARRVKVAMTRAPDYGIVRFFLDGRPVGEEVDLWAPEVTHAGEFDLGVRNLSARAHRLTVRLVGVNPQATGGGGMAGVDYILLEDAKE